MDKDDEELRRQIIEILADAVCDVAGIINAPELADRIIARLNKRTTKRPERFTDPKKE